MVYSNCTVQIEILNIFPSSRFSAYFGAVRGPIFLDNVRCVGTEFELSECAHLNFTVNNCHHSEDAGVACTGKLLVGGAGGGAVALNRAFLNGHIFSFVGPITVIL